MRRAAWFLLALVVPTAAAGSEEHPDVTDPADDVSPPGLPGTELVALWFGDETPTGFKVTLKVDRLETLQRVRYEVLWNHQKNLSHSDHRQPALRADVSPAGTTFELRPERNTPGVPIEGSVRPGRPGYVTWDVPFTQYPYEPGDVVVGMFAFASSMAPVVSDSADMMLGVTSYRQFGLGLALYAFEPPTVNATFVDDVDLAEPAVDIERAWVVFNPETVDFVVGVRDWQRVRENACDLLLTLSLSGPADWEVIRYPGRAHVYTGLNGTDGVRVIMNPAPESSRLGINLGAPGHVRLQIPRSAWHDVEDPALAQLSASTVVTYSAGSNCGEDDFFEYYPYQPDIIPGPSWLAGTAPLAALAFFRRRGAGQTTPAD